MLVKPAMSNILWQSYDQMLSSDMATRNAFVNLLLQPQYKLKKTKPSGLPWESLLVCPLLLSRERRVTRA